MMVEIMEKIKVAAGIGQDGELDRERHQRPRSNPKPKRPMLPDDLDVLEKAPKSRKATKTEEVTADT